MEQPINPFYAILAFSPFFIGIAFFLIYRRAVELRKSHQEKLERAADKLRHLRTAFRNHQNLVVNLYAEEEPYLSRVERYRGILLVSEVHLRKLHQEYRNLRQKFMDISTGAKNFSVNFIFLHNLTRAFENFNENLLKFEERLDELDLYREQIDTLAWDVASEVKKANSELADTIDKLNTLTRLGWRSSTLDQVKNQSTALSNTLHSQIPLVFHSPDPGIVLAQTEVIDVIRAHRVVASIADMIQSFFALAEKWTRSVATVENSIQTNQANLHLLQQNLNELERAEYFPVQMEATYDSLEIIVNRQARLFRILESRSLDDLLRIENEVSTINIQIQVIKQSLKNISECHSSLVAGSISEEVRGGKEILGELSDICSRLSQFHPSNFDRGDDVLSFSKDIELLDAVYQEIKDLHPLKPIHETEITRKLEFVKAFRSGLYLLNGRSKSIQETINSLRAKSKAIRHALSNLSSMTRYMLDEIIPSDKSETSRQLFNRIERLQNQLNDPQNIKLADVEAELSKNQESLKKQMFYWLDQLDGGIQSTTAAIEVGIEKMQGLGMMEIPFTEEFLKTKRSVNDRKNIDQAKPYDLDRVFSDLKHAKEQLSLIISISHKFHASTKPILDWTSKIEVKQQQINKTMAFLQHAIPEEGFGWPPTFQRFSGENYIIRQLDSEYGDLFTRQSDLHLRLPEIASRYEAIERKLLDLEAAVKQDHGKFAQYLQRYERSKKSWENLRSKNQKLPAFVQEVNDFLRESDERLAELEAAYRNGRYPPQQVLVLVRNLCRQLDEYTLNFDAGQTIDINGFVDRA